MKKLLKIPAVILLMLCFGASALFYFYFDAAQLHFKMEAERNILSNSSLEIIKLPVNEFRNNQTGDEVWISGKLYDISSYTVENDTAVISVFHDKGEEGLVKNIVENFEQTDQYTRDNGLRVFKHRPHVTDDTKIFVTACLVNFTSSEQLQHALPHPAPCHIQFHSAVITPPPNNV